MTLLAACLCTSPAWAEPARRVYVGVYLHDVARFDLKDGVFDVDAEAWAKWRGDFDPTQLTLANAGELEPKLLGEEADGEWHSARWRVRGTFRGEFPVQRFPFDAQTVSLVFELPARTAELLPDLAGRVRTGTKPLFVLAFSAQRGIQAASNGGVDAGAGSRRAG